MQYFSISHCLLEHLGNFLNKTNLSRLVEAWVWEGIDCLTNDVLSDIATSALIKSPPMHVYVFEGNISAWISLIAPNNARREDSTMSIDVAESNVSNCDTGLGETVLVKRIEHAAWATTVRLLLLLGPDVYGPPERSLDLESIIENILDDTIPIDPWVCLDIDSFEGILKGDVLESDVSHAVVI